MKTHNVYEYQNKLVSILKRANSAVVVIDNDGEVFSVETRELKPSHLIDGGVYSERFIQAALGGLVEAPYYKNRNEKVYKGKLAIAFVTPIDKTRIKLGVGIPFKALPSDMRPDHTGNDKQRRFENGRASTADNPVGPQKPVNSQKPADLYEGDTEGGLQIGSGNKEGIVNRVVLEWNEPMDDISAEEINNLFSDATVLPEPTTIKIDRGKETETHKRDASTQKQIKKADYYGLSPILTRTCPKCQSIMMITTEKQDNNDLDPLVQDKIISKCPMCGYSELYEGSLPGQGIAGQTNIN